MTLRDARLLMDKSISAWIDDYAASMGAAIAYYTLFSIAPLLIVLIAVSGMVFGPEAAEGQIVLQLQGQVGADAASAIQALLKSVNQPTTGAIATLLGLLTLLFGATSVFGEIQSALNRIWRVPDPPKYRRVVSLVRTRLRSFAMILILGFLLLTSLAFSAVLSAAGEWSRGRWFSGWETFLQFANFFVSFAINTLIFGMIYKIMPRARIAWRDVGIGATFTALLFEISKLLIGLYIGRGGAVSGFGAASSLVAFLVWVYLSAQIFLLGAEFTWVYSHQRGSRSERAATAALPVVPAVPTRAGDESPQAKIDVIIEEKPVTYPRTRQVARAAFAGAKAGASSVSRFARRKPVLGVGLLVGTAVLAAAILRSRRSASSVDSASGDGY